MSFNNQLEPLYTFGSYVPTKLDKVVNFIHSEMINNAQGWIRGTIRTENISSTVQFPFSIVSAFSSKLIAYIIWSVMVYRKQPWDHKDSIYKLIDTDYTYDSQLRVSYYYDIWSNIHYGYVGLACGFSEYELLSGAGVAQFIEHDQLPDKYWEAVKQNPLRAFEYLDDKPDQLAIKIGFELWKNYKLNITKDNILNLVRANYKNLQIKYGDHE